MSNSKTNDVRNAVAVGVIGLNASGEADVMFTQVHASPEEVRAGVHYSEAKHDAEVSGFTDALAFDEREPLWSALNASRGNPHHDMVARLVDRFSDLLVEKPPVGGFDGDSVVERLQSFLRTEVLARVDEKPFVAMSGGRYLAWGGAEGRHPDKMSPEHRPTLLMGNAQRDALIERGVTVIDIDAKDIVNGRIKLPPVEMLSDVVWAAVEVAEDEGVELTKENVVERAAPMLKTYTGALDDSAVGELLENECTSALAEIEVAISRNRPRER